jgi:hypothetical protein
MINSKYKKRSLRSKSKNRQKLTGILIFILTIALTTTFSIIYNGFFAINATNNIRVLFVGNSQTDFWNLPATVEALAKSAPGDRPRITVGKAIVNNTGLEGIWNSGYSFRTPRTKIQLGNWDYVVIQEAFAASGENFRNYALLFHELIKRKKAKTILFATASINELYPDGFNQIYDMNLALSKELGVPLASGGYAWLKYWGTNPTLEDRLYLYADDRMHPGERGSYIYACTLYAAITGFSPIGLTHEIPHFTQGTITPEKAYAFQQAAWNQYLEDNPS